MARFEDTPGLFGVGIGVSTLGDVRCEWCGKETTGRSNVQGEATQHVETIAVAHFGDKQICDCCFENVEGAVLDHIGKIVPWYLRILKAHRGRLEKDDAMMQDLRTLLQDMTKAS